ncbi:hypothetical protein MML48_3g00018587 [Holotrichia oblita]|uniref:Uncharacterized protein n=1 Tax=Holotrichia oblita TaxID=644536 RepID=A0ACB9TGZ1_HOLOL|nr:hypothetical protein MML48_3g00018587 [Holotrichia oblita]
MYLGVLMTNKCEEDKEIDRIAKCNNCLRGLHKVQKSKEVARTTKIRIYKTWIMNQKNRQKLDIQESKILRRIFGGKNTELGCERRMNAELYELFGEKPIGQIVKKRRLQWLGHLARMKANRSVKDIAWKKPEGRRKSDRPRKKWRDEIEEDLKEKNIRNWRDVAKNRKEWRRVTQV